MNGYVIKHANTYDGCEDRYRILWVNNLSEAVIYSSKEEAKAKTDRITIRMKIDFLVYEPPGYEYPSLDELMIKEIIE